MSKRPMRAVARLFAVLTAALTVGALATPAASAGPSVKLVLAASVDSGPRLLGKPFSISLSLTNTDTAPLTGIKASSSQLSGSWLNISDWGALATRGPGVTIDPGATGTFTLTASVYSWQQSDPRVRFRAEIPEFYQQQADLTIPLINPGTTAGSGGGVVYGDLNDNHTADPGEGLAGASVGIFAGLDRYETNTDADGRFTFTGVPAQRYGVSVSSRLPGGWVRVYENANLDIDGSGSVPDTNLRAVRPLSDQLHVTASLDRDLYQPGDTARVSITLTNSGTGTLTGITGECDRAGDSPDHIAGWRSWSDLVYPASVSLAPGESRTFEEIGTVPQVANQYGGFGVDCDFGPSDGEFEGYPVASLWARVPGAAADAELRIYHDDNHDLTQQPGEAISGTEVTLTDVLDGRSVASGVTDADGHVLFTAVPAGRYLVNVAGGWIHESGGDVTLQTGTCVLCDDATSLIFKRAA